MWWLQKPMTAFTWDVMLRYVSNITPREHTKSTGVMVTPQSWVASRSCLRRWFGGRTHRHSVLASFSWRRSVRTKALTSPMQETNLKQAASISPGKGWVVEDVDGGVICVFVIHHAVLFEDDLKRQCVDWESTGSRTERCRTPSLRDTFREHSPSIATYCERSGTRVVPLPPVGCVSAECPSVEWRQRCQRPPTVEKEEQGFLPLVDSAANITVDLHEVVSVQWLRRYADYFLVQAVVSRRSTSLLTATCSITSPMYTRLETVMQFCKLSFSRKGFLKVAWRLVPSAVGENCLMPRTCWWCSPRSWSGCRVSVSAAW